MLIPSPSVSPKKVYQYIVEPKFCKRKKYKNMQQQFYINERV